MSCNIEYGETKSASDTANTNALDALKQLLTLSAAVLTLTITFMKASVGPSSPAIVRYLVPFGWMCLMITIWTAWVAMAEAAKVLGTQGSKQYVFGSGRARGLARIAQWCFLMGLTALGLFAIYMMLSSSGYSVGET